MNNLSFIEKECKTCLKTLNRDEFYQSKGRIAAHCKECAREKARSYSVVMTGKTSKVVKRERHETIVDRAYWAVANKELMTRAWV